MEYRVRELRADERAWAGLIGCFVALNVLDLALTAHLISRGAVELNPIMAMLLDSGWQAAAGLKASVTLGVAVGLWWGRDHRLVRRTGVGFVVLFAAITAYQTLGVWVVR